MPTIGIRGWLASFSAVKLGPWLRTSQAVVFCLWCIQLPESHGRKPPKEGSSEWWALKKLEARMHQGRRVFSWEIEPPQSHPMWYNRSKEIDIFEETNWGPEGMHDLSTFEPVPRPLMPNWWCPTTCGTLNLSRETHSSSSSTPLPRHVF